MFCGVVTGYLCVSFYSLLRTFTYIGSFSMFKPENIHVRYNDMDIRLSYHNGKYDKYKESSRGCHRQIGGELLYSAEGLMADLHGGSNIHTGQEGWVKSVIEQRHDFKWNMTVTKAPQKCVFTEL